MCMMCVKTIVEAGLVSGAAVISGFAFLKHKYHLHKISKCDENGHCNCGCHCACHQNECDCECHKGITKKVVAKSKVKKSK